MHVITRLCINTHIHTHIIYLFICLNILTCSNSYTHTHTYVAMHTVDMHITNKSKRIRFSCEYVEI